MLMYDIIYILFDRIDHSIFKTLRRGEEKKERIFMNYNGFCSLLYFFLFVFVVVVSILVMDSFLFLLVLTIWERKSRKEKYLLTFSIILLLYYIRLNLHINLTCSLTIYIFFSTYVCVKTVWWERKNSFHLTSEFRIESNPNFSYHKDFYLTLLSPLYLLYRY